MKILFYDIETTPLLSWHWSLGDQVIRHKQLANMPDIMKYTLDVLDELVDLTAPRHYVDMVVD